jgi:hypothetical protein
MSFGDNHRVSTNGSQTLLTPLCSKENVPFFDCEDQDLELSYYYRWGTYKSHIIPTGFVRNPWTVSECLTLNNESTCNWAAPSGAINAAAGHHIREGRWIRDPQYMDSLIRFWYQCDNKFTNGSTSSLGASRSYSNWIAHAAMHRAAVTGNVSIFLTPCGANNTLLDLMVRAMLSSSHLCSLLTQPQPLTTGE